MVHPMYSVLDSWMCFNTLTNYRNVDREHFLAYFCEKGVHGGEEAGFAKLCNLPP